MDRIVKLMFIFLIVFIIYSAICAIAFTILYQRYKSKSSNVIETSEFRWESKKWK